MRNINFESFSKAFFKGIKEIQWFNYMGVKKLNDQVNAEIRIVTNGMSGTYKGYRVDIVKKNEGKITSCYFDFDDYMKERKDERLDYKGFCIIDHCCQNGEAKWYIAIPTDKEVKNMAKKIMDFTTLYA